MYSPATHDEAKGKDKYIRTNTIFMQQSYLDIRNSICAFYIVSFYNYTIQHNEIVAKKYQLSETLMSETFP